MASTPYAHLVRQNFAWRIEAISPSATDGNPKGRFFEVDPLRLDLGQTSGLTRSFSVMWLESEEDHVINGSVVSDNLSDRPAVHRYQVEVYYSTKLDYRTIHLLALQDRHDILRTLRNPDNHVGYDDSNTATSLNLCYRIKESDELDTSSDIAWVWRSVWRTVIEEIEN